MESEPVMRRRITQICDHRGQLWALCDDGTLWAWIEVSRRWKEIEDKIPGSEA